jgi:hypothetical protein
VHVTLQPPTGAQVLTKLHVFMCFLQRQDSDPDVWQPPARAGPRAGMAKARVPVSSSDGSSSGKFSNQQQTWLWKQYWYRQLAP